MTCGVLSGGVVWGKKKKKKRGLDVHFQKWEKTDAFLLIIPFALTNYKLEDLFCPILFLFLMVIVGRY